MFKICCSHLKSGRKPKSYFAQPIAPKPNFLKEKFHWVILFLSENKTPHEDVLKISFLETSKNLNKNKLNTKTTG